MSTGGGRRPTTPKPVPSKRRTGSRGSGRVVVRRMARAVDDGYDHPLVPGLRATADAARLADEMAFGVARVEELSTNPPGTYADAAAASDVEEGLWLAFLIAYLSPLELVEEPFANVERARVDWAGGDLPSLEGVAVGPRTAHDARRGDATFAAYRAWAGRAGSQHAALLGEESWTPQRRFDRAYERLSLPGFGRVPRYEFLVTVGRLGLVDIEPALLIYHDATAPTTVAAKRIFGIGDAMNLGRRTHELLSACDVPPAAFDLALQNWAALPGRRITAGSRAEVDPEVQARIRRVLRVPEPGDDGADDAG